MGTNTDLWSEMAKDAEEAVDFTIQTDKLNRLSQLANKQQEIEQWIEVQKDRLAQGVEALRRIREVELPEAMDEVGVAKFTLADGSSVSVNPYYSATITAEKKSAAHQWLDSHGFGDLIKTEVITKFGRGEVDAARELVENLRQQEYEVEGKESVHPQTLKAFIREQVESGAVAVPLDLFGAYVGRQTVIKKGK